MPIPALEAYKLQIDADITTQSPPDSIPPDVVGSGYTDLVDIITPYLEFDENRVFSGGSAVPDDLDGADGYIYFQGAVDGTITIWQKVAGSWEDNGFFIVNGAIPVIANTSDVNGEFDLSASSLAEFLTFSFFDEDGLSATYAYDNTNKIIKFMPPLTDFTARFAL